MRSLLLLPLACALAACTVHADSTPPKPSPSSSTLATSEMWPSMSAQTDGQTVKVYAALLKGSDFVLLAEGEYFAATLAGQSIVLQREPYVDGGKIHYFATFAAPTAASDVVIDFHRIAGFTEAAKSATTIPAVFAITSPAPPSFKIGATLSIAISPPPVVKTDGTDYMSVAFNGDCLADSTPQLVTFDVEGIAKVDTSKIVLKKGATGCDVGVQVRHETRGKADAAFANADTHPVEGLQARSFNTSLVP